MGIRDIDLLMLLALNRVASKSQLAWCIICVSYEKRHSIFVIQLGSQRWWCNSSLQLFVVCVWSVRSAFAPSAAITFIKFDLGLGVLTNGNMCLLWAVHSDGSYGIQRGILCRLSVHYFEGWVCHTNRSKELDYSDEDPASAWMLTFGLNFARRARFSGCVADLLYSGILMYGFYLSSHADNELTICGEPCLLRGVFSLFNLLE